MNTIPLSEISRPKTLDTIIGQESAVSTLKTYLTNPNSTPHLILSGPPGCGKTSAILAWARQVYKHKYTSNIRTGNSSPVHLLNMSALRSVKDVLSRIYDTCQYIQNTSGLEMSKGLVICDEADSLTAESQEILVYCLRKYSKRWVFVLIMNFPSRICDRLMNACLHVPFRPLTSITPILRKTVTQCNLGDKISNDDIQVLENIYSGDLRRILNAAQGVLYSGRGFVPEWTLSNDTDFQKTSLLYLYKFLHDKCHRDISAVENRLYLSLALSLHRPGSIRPILAAIKAFSK